MKRWRAAASPLVLLAVAAGLAFWAYRMWEELDDPVAFPEAIQEDLLVLESVDVPAAQPPAAMSFSSIVERPLFSPTRRPPEPAPPPELAPPAPAPPPPPPPPIDFSLVGVALSEGQRVALVQRQADGSVHRVIEGSEVLGWKAIRIEAEAALFRSGDRQEELRLRFAGGSTRDGPAMVEDPALLPAPVEYGSPNSSSGGDTETPDGIPPPN